MKLTILVDNTTNTRNLKAEAGLSIYIEDGANKILFDTGESALFLDNAQELGLSLLDLNYLVLSHGHHDHSWGLNHLVPLYNKKAKTLSNMPILIAHPLAFQRRVEGQEELGVTLSEETLSQTFNVKKSSDPLWITDRLVFLGEINRQFSFEGTHTIGHIIKGTGTEADLMQDDSALAYKSNQGLVIVTGCSHSGICNIVEQAKQVCHDDRILTIIGGLHLQKPPVEQLTKTLTYLSQAKIRNLYACHCTDQPSRITLAQLGNFCDVSVGLTLQIPE